MNADVTSFEVRVRLQRGNGWTLSTPVERVFLVGPQHTLSDLALAIEKEFDREEWEHWHMFRFEETTITGALGHYEEFVRREGYDPVTSDVKVSKFAEPGVHFEYVFDMGAMWTHDCFIPKRSLSKQPPTPLRIACISRVGETVPQYEEV